MADTSLPALLIVLLIQVTVKSHAVVYLSVQVCRGGAKLPAQSSVNRYFAIFDGRGDTDKIGSGSSVTLAVTLSNAISFQENNKKNNGQTNTCTLR